MAKKIVILNGSPRKNGNTSSLVKKFTEGAESVGNTVAEFFLDKMNIHGFKIEHLKWKNLGHVLAEGNGDVGDIAGKPELEQAYELGKSIQ